MLSSKVQENIVPSHEKQVRGKKKKTLKFANKGSHIFIDLFLSSCCFVSFYDVISQVWSQEETKERLGETQCLSYSLVPGRQSYSPQKGITRESTTGVGSTKQTGSRESKDPWVTLLGVRVQYKRKRVRGFH